MFFGLVLNLFPGPASEFVEFYGRSVFAVELGDLVQRMYAHVKHVAISVNQFDRFLPLALYLNFLKPREFSNPVIYMGNVITKLEIVQFFE